MTTLPLRQTHPGLVFWVQWMLATVAGAVAYVIMLIPLMRGITLLAPAGPESVAEPPIWLQLVLRAFGMGLLGAAIGLAQWLVLRRVLRGVGWWVPATMVGYAALNVAGWIWLLSVEPPPWLAGSTSFVLVGLVLGVAQWLVLRGRVERAGWWIAISVAGWTLALALTRLIILSGLYVEPMDMLSALLVPVAISGAGLVWLLQAHPVASGWRSGTSAAY